jgi:hypothetical protein
MPKQEAEPVPEPPKTELEEIQIQTNNVQNQVSITDFWVTYFKMQCSSDKNKNIPNFL